MCAQTPSAPTAPTALTAPPPPPPSPPPQPSALRPPPRPQRFAHPPTPHRHHLPSPHRSPPSLLRHCPHLAALGSVSAIVPTWLPLVRVLRLPMCAQTPSAPTALSKGWFLLVFPSRRSNRLQKLATPPPPHRPHHPHRCQRFTYTPHSPPQTLSAPTALSALPTHPLHIVTTFPPPPLLLCHCPHLAALASVLDPKAQLDASSQWRNIARLAWALWLKSGVIRHHCQPALTWNFVFNACCLPWIVTSQLSGSAALAAARKSGMAVMVQRGAR